MTQNNQIIDTGQHLVGNWHVTIALVFTGLKTNENIYFNQHPVSSYASQSG